MMEIFKNLYFFNYKLDFVQLCLNINETQKKRKLNESSKKF